MRAAKRALKTVLGNQHGSAAVEFIGASVLVLLMMLMVFQVSMFMYVRTVSIDALAQGAQVAARYDSNIAEGLAVAENILVNNFGENFKGKIRGKVVETGQERNVVLTAMVPMPILGFVGIPEAIEISAEAPIEMLGR
ncbi:MAG: pilus assembly protein [Microbacteriaceae bacterium]|nr:pilus assembly protein [Microbacteriaceae bacterium]